MELKDTDQVVFIMRFKDTGQEMDGEFPVCPGCENAIESPGEGIIYFGDYWHPCCAQEDKRINSCIAQNERMELK